MLTVSLFTPVYVPLMQGCSSCVIISSIITRIYQLTIEHFTLLQNSFLAGFGVKELLIDFLPQHLNSKPEMRTFTLIGSPEASSKEFTRLKAINKEFSLVHGMLYLNCGTAGMLDALHEMGYVNFSSHEPLFNYMASGLFLFVNLYSLEKNIELYLQADLLGEDEKYDKLKNSLKISSVLGILNNLGYITVSLFSFFPMDEIFYLVLVCATIFAGCFKILYDFFFLTPEMNLIESLV